MRTIKEKTKEQLGLSSDVRAIRIVDKIFNFAIGCEADEIHFIPKLQGLTVEFSAAGELLHTFSLPKKAELAVMTAIKEMAGLGSASASDQTKARFKKEYLGYKMIFSLRIHAPGAEKKISVNLRREKFELLGLGRLGLNKKALSAVKEKLVARKGLIAVIGDDDSGRTATLYSLINFLKSPDLNIATVEKEVAADLSGINQSRLNPRVGFSSGAAVNALRRQDLDVAMIGELNDRETAEAAFHLASAGHFVLSGINSPDLASALGFLRDLGLPLSVFASQAKLIITQRLVDKNCPYCLTQKKIGTEQLQRLKNELSLVRILPRLKRDKIISAKINKPEDLVFYKSRGCQCCRNSGSTGRVGIFEILEITPEVKRLIKTGHFSSVSEEVKKQGGYTLAEDALLKALNGLIPVEEIFKAIR